MTADERSRKLAKVRIFLLLSVGAIVLSVGLATQSPRVRVLYLSWRMRSGDRNVSLEARMRLREIGRPWIDEVYPELVARTVEDAVARVHDDETYVLFGDFDTVPRRAWESERLRVRSVVSGREGIVPVGSTVDVEFESGASRPTPGLSRNIVVVERRRHYTMINGRWTYSYEPFRLDLVDFEWLDSEDADAVIAAAKARLSSR